MEATKFLLPESAIPTHWYNVAADMPTPAQPPLHPGTGEPIGPDDLAPLFPMALILQEVSSDAEIEIPAPLREAYALWRPTPLHRARRLEQALGTRSKIFYKYEGTSPAGSHKPNTALAQAYYGKQDGRTRLATETGRGPVGQRARVRGAAVRPRDQGLDGQGLVPPEAVPADHDGDLGRLGRAEPLGGDECRPRRARRGPGLAGLARDRDLRGGRGRGDPRGHGVLARLGAESRAPAPDGDRAGGARADGAGRRVPGRGRRLRRRRLELRRPLVPVRAREDRRHARSRSSPASRRRARR